MLRVSEKSKVGDTLRVVGVASTLAGAQQLVHKAAGGNPQRLAIVERKFVYERKPAIEVVEISTSIVKS